jgi:hypothetical protein
MPPKTATPTTETVPEPSDRPQLTPDAEDVEMNDPAEVPEKFTVEANESLRVALPERYAGDRTKLKVFLLQVQIFFKFNEEKFLDYDSKTVWAISYLTGEALKWVEPYLEDYFANQDEDGVMTTTKRIFKSFGGFKAEIGRVFGDVDAVKTAERKIRELRQTGSAISYATEFQRHATITGWDTRALISQYEQGLKGHVLDEMARMDTPSTITGMIELSVKIDNRLHLRRQQSGKQQKDKASREEGRPKKSKWKGYAYKEKKWANKEVSATSQSLSPKERDRRREQRLCY